MRQEDLLEQMHRAAAGWGRRSRSIGVRIVSCWRSSGAAALGFTCITAFYNLDGGALGAHLQERAIEFLLHDRGDRCSGQHREGRTRTVEERLDEVLALMRAWHLERLQLDLGRTEAQALAVRLAAPAATAGWQLYNNLQGILGKVGRTIGSILSAIAKLFT